MKIKFSIILAGFIFLISCENDADKLAKAEKECADKTSIDGFSISFYGYFPEDVNSIQIKIKRGNQIIEDFQDFIPLEIRDSLRHLRVYNLKRNINLTDTVFVKINDEPEKIISDFKYIVRPHFTMMNRNWGCDFYELKVNDSLSEGAHVAFNKKNWKILEKTDFPDYYSKK